MKSDINVLLDALEVLTRDSIEMRNKAFESRVESHPWRPIKEAIDVLGQYDIDVKWGELNTK